MKQGSMSLNRKGHSSREIGGVSLTGTVIYHVRLSALPDAKRLEGISTFAIGLVGVRFLSGGKRG